MDNYVYKMLTFIPLVIIVIGIIGNLCNIIIFGKKTMRSTSTFRFLLYLSITDSIVLLVGATEMLIKNHFALELRDFSLFSCNFQKFLTYSFTYMSSCISIAVNVDRVQIVTGISMYQTSRLRNNTLNKSKRRHFYAQPNANVRFVDYTVILIVFSMCLVNIHYVIFMQSSSIIFFPQDANANETNSSLSSFVANKSSSHVRQKALVNLKIDSNW